MPTWPARRQGAPAPPQWPSRECHASLRSFGRSPASSCSIMHAWAKTALQHVAAHKSISAHTRPPDMRLAASVLAARAAVVGQPPQASSETPNVELWNFNYCRETVSCPSLLAASSSIEGLPVNVCWVHFAWLFSATATSYLWCLAASAKGSMPVSKNRIQAATPCFAYAGSSGFSKQLTRHPSPAKLLNTSLAGPWDPRRASATSGAVYPS